MWLPLHMFAVHTVGLKLPPHLRLWQRPLQYGALESVQPLHLPDGIW